MKKNVVYLAWIGFSEEGGQVFHFVWDNIKIDITSGGNVKKIVNEKNETLVIENRVDADLIDFLKSRCVAYMKQNQYMFEMFKIDMDELVEESE